MKIDTLKRLCLVRDEVERVMLENQRRVSEVAVDEAQYRAEAARMQMETARILLRQATGQLQEEWN